MIAAAPPANTLAAQVVASSTIPAHCAALKATSPTPHELASPGVPQKYGFVLMHVPISLAEMAKLVTAHWVQVFELHPKTPTRLLLEHVSE